MYFGAVEDDSCNCKTRCQNEQTYEHALEELDAFITQVVEATHTAAIEEVLSLAPKLTNSITGEVRYDPIIAEYMARITAIKQDKQ
jgi:hypothetical protein